MRAGLKEYSNLLNGPVDWAFYKTRNQASFKPLMNCSTIKNMTHKVGLDRGERWPQINWTVYYP